MIFFLSKIKKIISLLILIFFVAYSNFTLSSTSYYIGGEKGKELQKQAQEIFNSLTEEQKKKLAEKYTDGNVSKLQAMISDGKAGPITMGVLKSCVKLNTDIPGVGQYICDGEGNNKFGTLMGGLMKLLINFVVAVSFIALIASGVMMMFSGISQSTAGKGKELLKKVVIGIILLGLSGIILHTLNPNFFK